MADVSSTQSLSNGLPLMTLMASRPLSYSYGLRDQNRTVYESDEAFIKRLPPDLAADAAELLYSLTPARARIVDDEGRDVAVVLAQS